MGDTFSLKITDKVLYIQHLDRSRYDSTALFRFKEMVQPLLTELNLNENVYCLFSSPLFTNPVNGCCKGVAKDPADRTGVIAGKCRRGVDVVAQVMQKILH